MVSQRVCTEPGNHHRALRHLSLFKLARSPAGFFFSFHRSYLNFEWCKSKSQRQWRHICAVSDSVSECRSSVVMNIMNGIVLSL